MHRAVESLTSAWKLAGIRGRTSPLRGKVEGGSGIKIIK